MEIHLADQKKKLEGGKGKGKAEATIPEAIDSDVNITVNIS